MANRDDRKIVSNVRQGGEVYGPGREDELAAALSQERIEELVEAGALTGAWKGESAEAEEGSEAKAKGKAKK